MIDFVIVNYLINGLFNVYIRRRRGIEIYIYIKLKTNISYILRCNFFILIINYFISFQSNQECR
jgi:hypothetical protein